MGPLAPQEEPNGGESKKTALKWLDNMDGDKLDKEKLVTNKEDDDLIYKEADKIEKVKIHHKEKQLKPAIKKYQMDTNKVTGIANFSQLSKDPLKIPDYGLPQSAKAASTK